MVMDENNLQMDIDNESNNTTPPQFTNPNIYQLFSQFNPRHGPFWITGVRVYSIYKDCKDKKLYLFLADKNGDRAVACVCSEMTQHYERRTLKGNCFSIELFQFEGLGNDDFPRYEGYSIHRSEWLLWINQKTKLLPLNIKDEDSKLPIHPKLPTIQMAVNDKTKRRMLIDVVGKIVKAEFKRFQQPWFQHISCYLELTLIDSMGQQITMNFYDLHHILSIPMARAVHEKKLSSFLKLNFCIWLIIMF